MVSLVIHCNIDNKDALIAELYECGTTGIAENEEPGGACVLEAFFNTEDEALAILPDFDTLRPILKKHGTRNYVAEFQAQWPPMAVGRRLWLVAQWDQSTAPEGRLRLEYQAGMACGSGAHPCTRLCLEALDRAMHPRAAVLDVGAGSGILLLAAQLLGASRIAGCDIDADSVALARLAVPRALLFTGSTRAVRDASFDIVIANISSIAAEQLRDSLRRLCRPSGTIIVSGFRKDDLPANYRGESTELQGWACITDVA